MHTHRVALSLILAATLLPGSLSAQQAGKKMFGKGAPFTVAELPAGKLKTKLQTLDPEARGKAMQWLHRLSFQEFDAAEHLRVDDKGGIYIVCPDGHGNCDGKHHKHSANPSSGQEFSAPESIEEPTIEIPPPPTVEAAAVPVSSPPIYNSKPGATRHIYLDFNGAVVSGTNWSETDGTTTWTSWDCHAWSIDADRTTFSDAEQTQIQQIWQRIAEDYAPFDVNVTTQVTYDPDAYTGDKNKVGWLLMTPVIDKFGARCPHYGSGGVAYVGVFGDGNFFPLNQPAWVLAETSTAASTVAEAASHEMGHNMGLTHDGRSSPLEAYYGGHAATGSAPSWGPIMGTGYGQNVSQWSKGEYKNANQLQDDLAIISGRVPYRTDDHGNTPGSATALLNSSVNQTGVIERTSDADYFAFTTGAGTLTFNANTYRCAADTWGGNLDVILELYNQSNVLVASNNPAADVNAAISYSAAAGTYYLVVKPTGAGSPTNTTPSGYTVYGSLGKYTVTGTFVPADSLFLTSPIGGQNWVKSTNKSITWLSGMGGNVKIELFKGGLLDSTLSSNTANDGSFNWTISKDQPTGADYKIKITSLNTPSVFDESESNFSILAPSSDLLVANMDTNPGFATTGLFEYGTPVSPNKPTAAKTGTNIYDTDLNDTCYTASTLTTQAIDCSSHNNVNLEFWASAYVYTDFTIKFEVSNDNVNWTELFSQVGLNSNTWVKYNYNISSVADGQSTVYVRWSMLGSGAQYTGSGLGIDDVKVTGNFIPADDIYLVSPNGGETLTRQITNQIRWTSGMGGNVKIELFKAGVLNTTVVPSTWNDGLYETVLPSGVVAASDYTIKITSVEQPATSRTSAGTFTVVAPSGTIFSANLDIDPGFATTGLFEYGTPVSPNAVLTGKTGTKIYDTDLDATCWQASTLTTQAIDCSNHTAVNLEFWAHAYMHPDYSFKFEVSNNNTTWTQLFSQVGSTNNTWVKYTYNISAVANGQPTVYIRWSMIGSGLQYGGAGLAIDDIVITGTFSPTVQSYTVSYNGNGNTGGSVPISQIKEQGVDLTLAANSGNLVRTNYTYAGWNTTTDGGGTSYATGATYTANANVTLHARWTAGSYTVTLDKQSGTGGTDSVSATVGSAMPVAMAPTRATYTFAGYFTGTGGSGVQYYTAAMASARNWDITANTTLYAHWITNNYTVTFNGNGGGTPSPTSKSVTNGSTYGALATVSRAGYTLNGWFTLASGGTQVQSSTTVSLVADQMLYAQWTANTYTVTFDGNGGGTPNPTTKVVTHGSTYGALATVFRTGHIFNGWFTASSGGTQVQSSDTVAITGNQTLYAQWTVASYTVTFDANGGETPTPATKVVTYGSTYGALASVSRTGYTFNGWFTAASGGTQVQSATTVAITADQTLYAQWAAATYTVTLDANGGDVPSPTDKSVTFGAAYGTLATTSRSGFTFQGWFTAASGGAEVTAATTVATASNHTLFAQWSGSLAESLDTVGLSWSSSGNAPWLYQTSVSKDGGDAAQSGAITHDQTSSLTTTLIGPGTLTFWWKVSSEATYDYLRFFLDAAEQTGDLQPISGEVVWAQKTVSIPAGSHTVEWRYTKDFSVHAGSDTAWVDQVVYRTAVTYVGNGSTGGTVPVDASSPYASGATVSVLGNTGSLVRSGYTFSGWNTAANGSGTFYSPGQSFISNAPTTLHAIWSSAYFDWAGACGLSGGNAAAAANPDGDNLNNLQEFAFGMNPSSSVLAPLSYVSNGATVAGTPILEKPAGTYRAVFARRKDYVAAGLTYTVSFSADLAAWTTSASAPARLSGINGDPVETVGIDFPSNVPLQAGGSAAPKFFRVAVSTY